MRAGAFIGRLAQQAGVSVQTVRYYERLGLVPPPRRSPSGYRVYSSDAIGRLRFIRQAQALGFSLEEIREILRLKYGHRSPCECVRTLLKEKLADVERRMDALRRFRRDLHKTLARSRQPPLPHSASVICPIIESKWSKKSRRRKKK